MVKAHRIDVVHAAVQLVSFGSFRSDRNTSGEGGIPRGAKKP
jgi:hypothetical protein